MSLNALILSALVSAREVPVEHAPSTALVGRHVSSFGNRATDTAFAQEAGFHAEHARLYSDMRLYAGRSEWRGVEDAYQGILDLRGEKLSYADYFLAAQAAQAAGNVLETRKRLELARAIDSTPEVNEWISRLVLDYTRMHLMGSAEMTPVEYPLDPAQRAAIGAANERLQSGFPIHRMSFPDGKYVRNGKPLTVGVDIEEGLAQE